MALKKKTNRPIYSSGRFCFIPDTKISSYIKFNLINFPRNVKSIANFFRDIKNFSWEAHYRIPGCLLPIFSLCPILGSLSTAHFQPSTAYRMRNTSGTLKGHHKADVMLFHHFPASRTLIPAHPTVQALWATSLWLFCTWELPVFPTPPHYIITTACNQ